MRCDFGGPIGCMSCFQDYEDLNKMKWISVKKRLPCYGTRVLIYYPLEDGDAEKTTAYLDEDDLCWKVWVRSPDSDDIELDINMKDVTHWMSLPHSPQA